MEPTRGRRSQPVFANAELATARSAAPPRKKFPKHLIEIYDIDALLGQGAFSTVWRCKHRQTGKVRAVKKIDTSELPPREIAHEIAVMRLLRHDNVVRCYDVFLEAQFVNIVVDMFAGGDLIDGLNAHRRTRGRIPDSQLAHLARQMVAAVVHVHSLQIVHRDIKGENFLSDRPDIGDCGCRVALADFGTAVRIEPGEQLTTRVGTPAFWAPEMFAGGYDFVVDVWAVGVTAFILLTGALPFEGEEQICKPVASGEPPFAVPYFASQLCADFIGRCLEKDPRGRPQAVEAARHPWMATPPSQGTALLPSLKAPTSQEVSQSASMALGCCLDGLGAVVVGCCNGFAFCLDLLLPPTEPEASASFHLSEHPATDHPPDRDEIEKQITALSKQISISSVKVAG
mmetsp:Transcript_81803/g.226646  ORF Transcript_81803/g.226646 Transcript_81803/m.226646 type:complete len:400 (-) Transcript_81803:322-1521(-)|eukprot:CAMPEP_0179132770 /NCGR_PEP_ID=MMETSP0796-20121207/63116_1 /TAXON_ID=73915 /ORGANISM="Pyrodinium bahamense, Strain pbaha01" /LENGTH=399 /DNA_ID=CAMNT_0020831721 /DNA_START=62 /DNA_END=1261 /DNA_ORIENTATION=+